MFGQQPEGESNGSGPSEKVLQWSRGLNKVIMLKRVDN